MNLPGWDAPAWKSYNLKGISSTENDMVRVLGNWLVTIFSNPSAWIRGNTELQGVTVSSGDVGGMQGWENTSVSRRPWRKIVQNGKSTILDIWGKYYLFFFPSFILYVALIHPLTDTAFIESGYWAILSFGFDQVQLFVYFSAISCLRGINSYTKCPHRPPMCFPSISLPQSWPPGFPLRSV